MPVSFMLISSLVVHNIGAGRMADMQLRRQSAKLHTWVQLPLRSPFVGREKLAVLLEMPRPPKLFSAVLSPCLPDFRGSVDKR